MLHHTSRTTTTATSTDRGPTVRTILRVHRFGGRACVEFSPRMLTITDPYGETERTELLYRPDDGELMDAVVNWLGYAHRAAQQPDRTLSALHTERLQRIAGAMGLAYQSPQVGGEAA
jgi:hypothetical protein